MVQHVLSLTESVMKTKAMIIQTDKGKTLVTIDEKSL